MNTFEKVEKQKVVYDKAIKTLEELAKQTGIEKLELLRKNFWDIVGNPPIPIFTKLNWRRLRMLRHYEGMDLTFTVITAGMWSVLLILLSGAFMISVSSSLFIFLGLIGICFTYYYNKPKRNQRKFRELDRI